MAEEASAAPAKSGSPMKLVIVMIVGAILLVAVSMGGVFFLMKSMGMAGGGAGGGNVKDDSAPAIYHALEPAFVVNFKERGRSRFLQVEVQVMSRDKQMIDELDKHTPVIRNNLLLLFSGQTAETLHSSEGKEQLRQNALAELNKILEAETGQVEAIEALYFTSFVTQ